MQELACPKCGTDNVRSVPLIYAEGTTRVEVAAAYIGTKDNYGVAPMFGSSQTLAARRLSPPARKSAEWVAGWIVIALAAFIVGAMFYWGRESYGLGGMLMVVGPIVGIMGAMATASNVREYNESVWEPAYEAWQRSFLCQRCGTIFETDDLMESTLSR